MVTKISSLRRLSALFTLGYLCVILRTTGKVGSSDHELITDLGSVEKHLHHSQSLALEETPPVESTIYNDRVMITKKENRQEFQKHDEDLHSLPITPAQHLQALYSELEVSPACRPSWRRDEYNGRIRRIFFAHTRKAAGTTLQRFLERVAREYRWKFDYVEGRPAEEPTRNDTLYVTSLREPVARALTHYKYEIRWPCSKMVSPAEYPDFQPLPNNSRTLEDFIERESGKFSQKECWRKPAKRVLWRCAKNCYLRWYGANFNCIKNPQKSYETALQKLLKYNLIVITENLNDPSYVQGIMNFFGNVNTTILSSTQKMYCFDESRYWNNRYPAVMSNEIIANLTRLNELDIQLYKELTTCQDGIHFPDFEPGRRRGSRINARKKIKSMA